MKSKIFNKKLRTLVAMGLVGINVTPISAYAQIGIDYQQQPYTPLIKPTAAEKGETKTLSQAYDEALRTNKEEIARQKEAFSKKQDVHAGSMQEGQESENAVAGDAASVLSGASAKQGEHAAAKEAVLGSQSDIQNAAQNLGKPVADTPDKAPSVSNKSLMLANSTDSDKAVQGNVVDSKLPVLKISEDGKTVVDSSANNGENTTPSLADINKESMKQAQNQQENQTSNDAATSYQVQTATGESVIVTKNPCYQKSEQRCLQNYTTSWTDSNGVYHTTQVPLNTLEYLSGSVKLTSDMIQQARRQEAYTQATNNALAGNTSLSVNPVESVTSSVQEMIAYGADPKEAIVSGLLAYASQLQSSDTMKSVKAYGEGMQAIQKAKDDAVYSRTEEIQQSTGVLSAQKNKRFRPRLIPDIPVINSEHPIKVSLVTPSGQPNDKSQYTIIATVRNQNTGKIEHFEVLENTPFIVELPEWTKKPGRRNVAITYVFTNSAVKENYSFSYKVGQMATAILPNGKTVANSVTALAGNRDILNYNSTGQAVAGRIKDLKWDNGMCFMEMTDAKDDTNIKYPSVVVASDKVEQSTCSKENLVGKYISMENVTSRVDDNGQYIYVDNSDGDQVSIMNEAGYDALEDKEAAAAQYYGDKNWDGNVLKVTDDGTIYEALPGKLGVNYLNINLGSGTKANVAISIDPETQTYRFSKADGENYSPAELKAKGIDPTVIKIGLDQATGLAVAYDAKTHQILSNNAFDASDTSNLSRRVIGGDGLNKLNTDGSLTRNRITAALGETGSAVVGQAISTFSSMINGATKAVTSLTGNIASIGGGTFATISTAALGNETPLSGVSKNVAEAEALKICSTVPDRCQEAMQAIK